MLYQNIIKILVLFILTYVNANNLTSAEDITENSKGYQRVNFPPPKSLTFDEDWIKRSSGNSMHIDEFYLKDVTRMKEVSPIPIDWSNIVIFITIYRSDHADQLITAHFGTWLKQVDKGLDIVFVTDKSDERSIDEILPDAKFVSPKSHVYKSAAAFDGKHIRFKVIDSLKQMEHLFHKDSRKKYFLKMDLDTFLFSENLLAYLQKLEKSTFGQPVLFGKCIGSLYSMCYAAGGLYGMNKEGLIEINKYFKSHREVTKEIHPIEYGRLEGKSNYMAHEDFMVSYVYRKATGYPVVMNYQFYMFDFSRANTANLDSELFPPICYHNIKEPRGFYEHYALFYLSEKRRSFDMIKLSWKSETQRFKFLRTGKIPLKKS